MGERCTCGYDEDDCLSPYSGDPQEALRRETEQLGTDTNAALEQQQPAMPDAFDASGLPLTDRNGE